MVAIHHEMTTELLCFLVPMPTCWACSQRRLIHSSSCFKYLAQRFPKWLHWNRCGPNVMTYSLRLSLSAAHLCTCLLFFVAPSCALAQSVTGSLSAHSHAIVTLLLLLCLQCAFWMISWGYQTFLKETLSINIFLILNFTIRGPCLNLCQCEGKLSQNRDMVWEEIELKLFWWKQLCLLVSGIPCDIIISMLCPVFSLHLPSESTNLIRRKKCIIDKEWNGKSQNWAGKHPPPKVRHVRYSLKSRCEQYRWLVSVRLFCFSTSAARVAVPSSWSVSLFFLPVPAFQGYENDPRTVGQLYVSVDGVSQMLAPRRTRTISKPVNAISLVLQDSHERNTRATRWRLWEEAGGSVSSQHGQQSWRPIQCPWFRVKEETSFLPPKKS